MGGKESIHSAIISGERVLPSRHPLPMLTKLVEAHAIPATLLVSTTMAPAVTSDLALYMAAGVASREGIV